MILEGLLVRQLDQQLMSEMEEGTKEMAQYYPTQENVLNIKVQYYNELDIQELFTDVGKDPSFCYKFCWLEAIVNLISEGITETTFDAIIDEMIANAWYSVREFHIHLSGLQADGMVRDGLE